MRKKNSPKTAKPEAMAHVPMAKWGKDHWSTLAYAETCVVDKNGVEGEFGTLDRCRMSCNGTRHPALVSGRISTEMTLWKPQYSTRLRGFFENPGDPAYQVADHDDWDCLLDAEHEGLLDIVSLANGTVRFHPLGLRIAAALRAHKAKGGMFFDFIYAPEPHNCQKETVLVERSVTSLIDVHQCQVCGVRTSKQKQLCQTI